MQRNENPRLLQLLCDAVGSLAAGRYGQKAFAFEPDAGACGNNEIQRLAALLRTARRASPADFGRLARRDGRLSGICTLISGGDDGHPAANAAFTVANRTIVADASSARACLIPRIFMAIPPSCIKSKDRRSNSPSQQREPLCEVQRTSCPRGLSYRSWPGNAVCKSDENAGEGFPFIRTSQPGTNVFDGTLKMPSSGRRCQAS